MSVSVFVRLDGDDGINVSNVNFYRLMGLLGIEVDAYGDLSGEWKGRALFDLKAEVMFALDHIRAMPDVLDAGMASHVEGGDGKCTIIHGGLPPGYFQDRLVKLLALIDDALETGLPLRYC